jgi:hypothetical protein
LANGFTLEMYSLQTNAAADLAIAKAIKVEELEGPQKEADRQKKEADLKNAAFTGEVGTGSEMSG